MASRTVYGAEALIDISLWIQAKGHRYEDHVALIPLNMLQVFNEEWFSACFHLFLILLCEGVVFKTLLEHLFNEITLHRIKRNNPQRFGRIFTHMVERHIDHAICLNHIPAILINAVGDMA